MIYSLIPWGNPYQKVFRPSLLGTTINYKWYHPQLASTDFTGGTQALLPVVPLDSFLVVLPPTPPLVSTLRWHISFLRWSPHCMEDEVSACCEYHGSKKVEYSWKNNVFPITMTIRMMQQKRHDTDEKTRQEKWLKLPCAMELGKSWHWRSISRGTQNGWSILRRKMKRTRM